MTLYAFVKSLSHFLFPKNDSSLKDGAETRIEFDIKFGQGLAPVRKPQKLVATASRREDVYNRTGEPSVIFAEKEELHSE